LGGEFAELSALRYDLKQTCPAKTLRTGERRRKRIDCSANIPKRKHTIGKKTQKPSLEFDGDNKKKASKAQEELMEDVQKTPILLWLTIVQPNLTE